MTDLTVFKNKAPSAAFAALNPQAESLADGIGGGYGVIHFKGKTWSLRLRGESYTFVRQDDGTPLSYLDVIILRQLPVKSKTYYPKGAWEGGEKGAPLCSSLDGITPEAGVTQQQSSACAICPRNEVKTSLDGRKGRECRDNKRLAVLIVPSLSKALLGAPLMEPVMLRVPAASLAALAKMGTDMASKGWHYSAFITRIGFVMESEFPQMTFTPLQELTEKEAPIVLPMREDPLAYRVTGEDVLSKPRQPQIATEPPLQQPAKKTTPPPVTLDLQAEPETIDAGFGDEVNALTNMVKGKPPYGEAKTNVVPMTAVTQTAEDTGETEESDADMDARVAALLKTS